MIDLMANQLWREFYTAHPEHRDLDRMVAGERYVKTATLRAFVQWCVATQHTSKARARKLLEVIEGMERLGTVRNN
jgi:hypothetical protein